MITPDLEEEIIYEFGKELGEEIIAKIVCGYSVDNAIQTVLERDDK